MVHQKFHIDRSGNRRGKYRGKYRGNRRDFLLATAGIGFAAGVSTRLANSAEISSANRFGNGELRVLSDGHLSLPRDFMFPASIDAAELSALLKLHNLDTPILTADCNVTLWKDDARLVLFDVGAGHNFVPTAGKLLSNLSAAGIDPADVTDVVFTHAHPDHLWGLLDDFDELICPNATYHMATQEWEYWRASDTLSKTPEFRKTFVVGAQNRFSAMEEKIRLFTPGQEILPGIEAVATVGHTPGHTSFALHSGNESLVLIGDAFTNVAVSFAKPNWPTGADHDAETAQATRVKLLDRLAKDKSLIVGYHLPFPGLGRVERSGNHYRYVV